MSWYKIFDTEEQAYNALKIGGTKAFTLQGESVCLFRTKSGLWALENKCPHQNLPLKGSLYVGNDVFECPYHFLKYQVRTGVVGMSDKYPPIKSFPVKITAAGVFIEVI